MVTRKPKPEREYLVREYGSRESFEDGANALASEGYELRSWRVDHRHAELPIATQVQVDGIVIIAHYRRAKQTVLIVKTT